MEDKLIFSKGSYEIFRHNHITQEASAFLEGITWGNKGTIYEHKQTSEHIAHIHQPILFCARVDQKIVGTAVFCNTPVACGSYKYNCYYVRYFAAEPSIRGNGMVPRISLSLMRAIREESNDKTIYFACVEKSNTTSYKIVSHVGYQNIACIKTQGFSRFYPAQQNIEQVRSAVEKEEILDLLTAQYKGHALVQFNSIFMHDNYFVIRKNGEIVAGCQYHRVHWVVRSMKGRTGRLIMAMVPRIPLLRKLYNPSDFQFLAFEGIYVKPGYEQQLSLLFEGLLARENLNSGLYWMAENCPVRKRITDKIQPGILHTFVKDADSNIMANFHHFSEAEEKTIKDMPVYASAFDYI